MTANGWSVIHGSQLVNSFAQRIIWSKFIPIFQLFYAFTPFCRKRLLALLAFCGEFYLYRLIWLVSRYFTRHSASCYSYLFSWASVSKLFSQKCVAFFKFCFFIYTIQCRKEIKEAGSVTKSSMNNDSKPGHFQNSLHKEVKSPNIFIFHFSKLYT